MTNEYEEFDFIEVKTGVMDINMPNHALDGYQGRVYDRIETADGSEIVKVVWDSYTLLNLIPGDVIEEYMERDESWLTTTLSAEDILPAEAHDTKKDVDNAVTTVFKRHDEFFSSDMYLLMEPQMHNADGKPALDFSDRLAAAGYDEKDAAYYRLFRLQNYEIVTLYVEAPETQAGLAEWPYSQYDVEFWIENLLVKLHDFEDVSLKTATVANISAVFNRIFPENVTLHDPEDAQYIVPIILGFLKFIKLTYQDEVADIDGILVYLEDLEPDYPEIMNDETRFGTNKQLIMMFAKQGVDVTDEEQVEQAVQTYKAKLFGDLPDAEYTDEYLDAPYSTDTSLDDDSEEEEVGYTPSVPKISAEKRKQKRKQAKASRKANRKRKK